MSNTGLASRAPSLSQIRQMCIGSMQYASMEKRKLKWLPLIFKFDVNYVMKIHFFRGEFIFKMDCSFIQKRSQNSYFHHIIQIIVVRMQENVSWKLGFLQIVTPKRPINIASPWKDFQLGLSDLLYASTLGKDNSLAVSVSISFHRL